MIKGKDPELKPDPPLWLVDSDLDPGCPTGSGSPTLMQINENFARNLIFSVKPVFSWLFFLLLKSQYRTYLIHHYRFLHPRDWRTLSTKLKKTSEIGCTKSVWEARYQTLGIFSPGEEQHICNWPNFSSLPSRGGCMSLFSVFFILSAHCTIIKVGQECIPLKKWST